MCCFKSRPVEVAAALCDACMFFLQCAPLAPSLPSLNPSLPPSLPVSVRWGLVASNVFPSGLLVVMSLIDQLARVMRAMLDLLVTRSAYSATHACNAPRRSTTMLHHTTQCSSALYQTWPHKAGCRHCNAPARRTDVAGGLIISSLSGQCNPSCAAKTRHLTNCRHCSSTAEQYTYDSSSSEPCGSCE